MIQGWACVLVFRILCGLLDGGADEFLVFLSLGGQSWRLRAVEAASTDS